MTDHVTFGEARLTIEQVVALSQRSTRARLQDDAAYREKIAKGARFLDTLLTRKG